MFCSFCKKTASKLVTHSLCDCCLVHLECSEATEANQLADHSTKIVVPVISVEVANRKVDCEICLEQYSRDELEVHREICTAQLMFRCAVCNGDYVSKEGLWNHLDQHEIADARKESYYRETRATYKLHRCELCNDQRGYQESLYWTHVHEDHDGFFLQCSGCGDNFRSQKSKNDHALSQCKAILKQTVPRVDHTFGNIDCSIKVEAPSLDSFGGWNQCGNAAEGMDSSMTGEDSMTTENNVLDPIGGTSSSGPSEAKCSYCDKKFPDQSLLTSHVENSHLPNVCNICGETVYGRTRFRYHKLKNHSDPKHKCPYCPMEFHRNNNFQRHMSRHVEERNFPCELCGAKFKSVHYVALHKRRYHQVKKLQATSTDCSGMNSVDESSQPSDLVASDGESSTIYHCPVCDVKFDDEELFSQHVGTVHQLAVCTICGTTFASVDQLNEHKETHHPIVKYSCSQCNQTFDKKTSFQVHLAEHEKKAKFQCGLCDHQFETQSTLQSHMVSSHNTVMNPDGVQCTCPICGETISSILMFRHHKLKFHTEPEYQCPHCPRKFHTKGNYMCHVVVHKRKRIFSCRFCSVRYKRLHMLQAHMERRHGNELKNADLSGQIIAMENQDLAHPENVDSEDLDHENSMSTCKQGEGKEDVEIKEEILVEEAAVAPASSNPTECSQCHQLFSDANELQDHLRVSHQSMKCSNCGLDFENQARLRYHKLIAHTEPRYKCSHCEKTFYVKTALVRHESTHRKEDGSENSLKPIIRIRNRSKSAKTTTRETDQSTGIECNLCSRKFQTEESLQRHIDYTHSKAEVQCTICDLTFPSQYKMRYHKTKVHTEAQHKCPHCEKKFHVKYRLREHLVVHLTLGDGRNQDGSEDLAKVKEET